MKATKVLKPGAGIGLGILLFASLTAGMSLAADPRLGAMQLLEGYEHEVLQGIDSTVGTIRKKDGLLIHYEIGTVPKPGVPRMGGQFTDRPKQTPRDQIRWYREQFVDGQPVHLAHRKDDLLMVSFPRRGMNFSVTVRTADEMAEALLMILTYADGVSA